MQASGDADHHRHEDGGGADVVDKGAEEGDGEHQRDDQADFILAGEVEDLFADLVDRPGIGDAGADDEHGRHRDDGRVGEAAERLLGGDEPGQTEGQQDHETDQVHADPFGGEQDQRDGEDGQGQGDFHVAPLSGFGAGRFHRLSGPHL